MNAPYLDKDAHVFVMDDACLYPASHHPVLIAECISLFRERGFKNITPLVCKGLTLTTKDITEKSKVFPFLYHDVNFNNYLFKCTGIEVNTIRIYGVFKKFIKNYDISEKDIIVFPTATYYSINGLCNNILNGTFDKGVPRIYFCMLNTVEFSGLAPISKNAAVISGLFDKVKQLHPNSITLIAESKNYIDYLEKKFHISGVKKFYLFNPNPLDEQDNSSLNERNSIEQNEVLGFHTIFCPGSQGRRNKGFYRLWDIYQNILSLDSELAKRLKFIVQEPKLHTSQQLEYLDNLKDSQNFKIVETYIEENQKRRYYLESDVILMPYEVDKITDTDFNSYMLRGSGIYIETIRFKKISVIPNDVGFLDDIIKYGNAITCHNTNKDIASAIIKSIKLDKSKINKMTNSAFENYTQEFEKNVSEIFSI